jgi:hypothetical protein
VVQPPHAGGAVGPGRVGPSRMAIVGCATGSLVRNGASSGRGAADAMVTRS